jgi:hypothetical protein
MITTEPDELRASKPEEISIYVRRWRPADFALDDLVEVIVDDTAGDLITKVVNAVAYYFFFYKQLSNILLPTSTNLTTCPALRAVFSDCMNQKQVGSELRFIR